MQGPVPTQGRLEMMDALRGFALLGILTMNIRGFAMLEPAYLNPFFAGPLNGADSAAFVIGQLFFNFKFMSLFSMLFGAGLALQYMSRRSDPKSATRLHLRRMGWLFMFGLAHGILLFYGDILATYALCGLVFFGLRKRSPKTLLIWAGALMVGLTLVNMLGYWGMQFRPDDVVQEMQADWTPNPEQTLEMMAYFTGDFWTQTAHRAEIVLSTLTLLFLVFGLWKVGAMMLVGMALFKLTVFGGRLPKKVYAAMAIGGLTMGLLIEGLNTSYQWSSGYEDRYAFTLGIMITGWSSLFMALGYIGLFYLVMPAKALSGIRTRLAQLGRLAFSNYILTSLIASLIFNGHGLGLYNQFGYAALAPIVLGIWLLLLAWTPLWLRFRQRGPLEALWRRLSYGSAAA